MHGDVIVDDDGKERETVWDGSRGSFSLLGDRRERMNEVYGYGFEITRRAPWDGQKSRKKRRKDSEES